MNGIYLDFILQMFCKFPSKLMFLVEVISNIL